MAINETTGRKYHSTKGTWTSKTGLESWIYQCSAWIGWQISLERRSANNKFCKPPAKLKLDQVFHRPLQMENLNYEFPGGGTFRKFIYPPDWIQSESVNKVRDYFQWGYFHSALTQVFLEKLKLVIFFLYICPPTQEKTFCHNRGYFCDFCLLICMWANITAISKRFQRYLYITPSRHLKVAVRKNLCFT